MEADAAAAQALAEAAGQAGVENLEQQQQQQQQLRDIYHGEYSSFRCPVLGGSVIYTEAEQNGLDVPLFETAQNRDEHLHHHILGAQDNLFDVEDFTDEDLKFDDLPTENGVTVGDAEEDQLGAIIDDAAPHAPSAEWFHEQLALQHGYLSFEPQGSTIAEHVWNAMCSPIDAADLYFSAIIPLLVLETNRNAHNMMKKKRTLPKFMHGWNDTNNGEMSVYLAVLLFMGLKPLPQSEMYWSNLPLQGEEFVKRHMSRRRFEQLKTSLAVSNPTIKEAQDNPVSSVKPLLDLFGEISSRIYEPAEFLAVDEIPLPAHLTYPTNGHDGIPSDYIKLYEIRDVEGGFCMGLRLDERKDDKPASIYFEELATYLPKKPYKVLSSRAYLTVDLCRKLQLKSIYPFGYVDLNFPVPDEFLHDMERGPLGEGEFRWRMAHSQPTPLLYGVFRKSRNLVIMSTYHDATLVTHGEEDVVPELFSDLASTLTKLDEARSDEWHCLLYGPHYRTWQTTAIYHCLDVVCGNARLLFNRRTQQHMSSSQFRFQLIHELAQRGISQPTLTEPNKRRRITTKVNLPAERLSKEPHLVDRFDNGKRYACKYCWYDTKKQSKSAFLCTTCKIALHPDTCFRLYHTVGRPDSVL